MHKVFINYSSRIFCQSTPEPNLSNEILYSLRILKELKKHPVSPFGILKNLKTQMARCWLFLVREGWVKFTPDTLDIPCIGVELQTNDGGVHKLD